MHALPRNATQPQPAFSPYFHILPSKCRHNPSKHLPQTLFTAFSLPYSLPYSAVKAEASRTDVTRLSACGTRTRDRANLEPKSNPDMTGPSATMNERSITETMTHLDHQNLIERWQERAGHD